MSISKDPFEAAFEEQEQQEEEESPPDSPSAPNEVDTHTSAAGPSGTVNRQLMEDEKMVTKPNTTSGVHRSGGTQQGSKTKDEDEEEEEENMEVELSKFRSADPHKMARMQFVLSQMDEGQMSRYESFRRSGFQKSNMKRLLVSITGSQKISVPITIVVSGIAKMFVGDLVETARTVMKEREDSGPIRPSHLREAYRRLKLEGKVPRRSVQRLFR